MKPEPKISVIIPIYQAEDYLSECLDSVRNQTYQNLEVILVDDSSTDGSARIAQKYCDKDSRFQLICRKENGGLSAARNTGLNNITGSQVLFLDSDDIISPEHISCLFRAKSSTGADIAITSLTPFHNVFNPHHISDNFIVYDSADTLKIIFYQQDFDTCIPAKLYPTALLEGIRFPEGYIHEDLATLYKIIIRADKCVYVESDSYGYRYQQSGLNHSITNNNKVRTVSLINDAVTFVDENYPQLSKSVRCFRCSFCFHLLLNATNNSISEKNRRLLISQIKQDRWTVLKDKDARRKTRLACLLSYIGFKSVSKIFHSMRNN